MSETLAIRVNHERPNTFEVPDTFETEEDFSLEIRNEGKPVHMHLNIDDDLAAGLSMETGNHFIPRKGAISLPVEVDRSERPFHGKCRVSTGYGAETKFVEIRVFEPDEETVVSVDERLSEPPARAGQGGMSEGLNEIGVWVLLGLTSLALLGAAVIVAASTTPLVGVIVVILVIVIAVSVYVAFGER